MALAAIASTLSDAAAKASDIRRREHVSRLLRAALAFIAASLILVEAYTSSILRLGYRALSLVRIVPVWLHIVSALLVNRLCLTPVGLRQ